MADTNGNPTNEELLRQHPQHELAKSAFGGLTLDTTDLTSPALKILDVGTGNGFWLYDLRQHLAHPDTADLVGTDSTLLPPEQRPFPISKNMRFICQDPHEEWPVDLSGYFDLVHQRNALASASGSFEAAVDSTARVLRLVKPGGAILLIDRCFEPGTMASTDTPSSKLFKMLGNMFSSSGNDGTLGGELPAILDVAGAKAGIKLVDIGLKKSVSRMGVGAPEGMEEVGYAWLEQLQKSVSGIGDSMAGSVQELIAQTIEEAKSTGFDMTWYAAWAKRAGAEMVVELPA